jgi:hypothetical protein
MRQLQLGVIGNIWFALGAYMEAMQVRDLLNIKTYEKSFNELDDCELLWCWILMCVVRSSIIWSIKPFEKTFNKLDDCEFLWCWILMYIVRSSIIWSIKPYEKTLSNLKIVSFCGVGFVSPGREILKLLAITTEHCRFLSAASFSSFQ